MTFDTPHLSLPLRLDSTGRAVEIEQDSPEHLADRLIAASRTVLGLRADDPEFGRPEQTFRAGAIDIDSLRAALVESEPSCAHFVSRIEDVEDLRRDRLIIMITEEGFTNG
jgi:hypothetical protein